MNKKPNYKQLFAIQKRLEGVVLEACPTMPHASGIYFYTRVDENGKHAYIGKAVDLIKRSVSHLQGYQRIDLSLRKRGFFSKENETGWHLNYLLIPKHLLDEQEAHYIKLYQENGYELYNIESGGTTGKTIINERKGPKTYTEGKKEGKKQLVRELKDIIDKYLVISLKKEGRLAENGLKKFWDLLSINE